MFILKRFKYKWFEIKESGLFKVILLINQEDEDAIKSVLSEGDEDIRGSGIRCDCNDMIN